MTLSHESRFVLTLLFLLALYMLCEWAGEIPWSAP